MTNSQELWDTYYADRSDQNRNALVVHYRSVSQRAARDRQPFGGGTFTFEEFVSAADLRLISAVEKYRPEMGLKFKIYAYFCCVGGVLDYIRESDHLTRSHRQRVSSGEAEDPKISLDAGNSIVLEDIRIQSPPEDRLEECLEAVCSCLTSDEERVMREYYGHEKKTMKEIGEKMGLTQGRVSQIHAIAIKFLRSRGDRLKELLY